MSSEVPLRPWWVRALALTGLALALSVYVWWPAINLLPNTQTGDGAYFTRVIDMAHVAVLRYRELPLWNAYECGGVPLWDNPEMPVASPLIYLTLPFSAATSMIIWYVVHSAVGFIGMWLFARDDLKVGRNPAFIAACLWTFGAGHVHQYAGGHATLVTFLFVPLAFYLWRLAEEDVDYAVGLGLLFAWMMFDGGAYPIVHTALLLAVETVIRCFRVRRAPRIIAMGLVAVTVCFLVGAARFIPVFDQLRSHQRELAVEIDALSWRTLKDMFLERAHGTFVEGQTYVWGEYIVTTGIAVLLIAVIGMVLGGVETAWLVVVGALCFALMMGHQSPRWPWAYLKAHVFPFKGMRVPSRFRLSLMFAISAFLAVAVERIPLVLKRNVRLHRFAQPTGWFFAAIALLSVGTVVGFSSDIISTKFTGAAEQTVEPSPRFYLEGPNLAAWLDQPRQNRGRMLCLDSWPFTMDAPLWYGDVPQARAADNAATVTDITRTPNSLTMVVTANRYARIQVNLPYEKNWRTNVGHTFDEGKRLGVEVPPGRWLVRLRYRPYGILAGLRISIAGAVGALFFLLRRRLLPLAARLETRLRRKPAKPTAEG